MKTRLLLLFSLVNLSLYSQSSAIDSIQTYLEQSYKVYHHNKLPLLEKALDLAEKTQIDSLVKKTAYEYGLHSYYNKHRQGLYKANGQILTLFRKTKDSVYLAKYYHFKALEQKIKLDVDSAFYYYHHSKDISNAIKDSLEIGRRLLSIALLQKDAKDYLGSEISSIEALKYFEALKSYKYLERVYNVLGLVSEELNQKEDAINYYNKALEINTININDAGYLYIINNLGLLYQNNRQHKKALDYFEKGFNLDSLKTKFPKHYCLLLENLAFSEYSLGKKENTLKRYNEVLAVRTELKEDNELSTTHMNISNHYRDFNQNKKAIFHANEALQYAQQTHNNKRWLEALRMLSELSTGVSSKAYLEQYITLNDSLFQQERRLKNQFAKIRYETDKKEKENVVLKTDNQQKQAEITYQKQQSTIGWLLAATSLLLFVLSFLSFVFRRKRLLYQAKLQKAEAREKERQQIAKSLHDEVAGDLRLLHQRLEKSHLFEEAKKLETVKDNVRNLSHQLSSVHFNKVSFEDQIINLVSDYFSSDFRISISGLKDHNWSIVNNAIKRLLYLGLRESIQNCQKHAQACKLNITFTIHKKNVFLTIIDDGIGFDTTTNKKGIGLLNLQERVEELNGKLTIESTIGKGTTTRIQIPLDVTNN